MQPPSMSQVNKPVKETHWFDQMCEVISTQQSRHEAGSLDTPPMLTPGNYVQWASRFLRFFELKKPHGKYLKKVILEGPFQWPTITVTGDPSALPPRPDSTILVSENQLTVEQVLHHEADQYAMIYILQGIPNPIFKSADTQKTAKAMWEHVHLLMEGTKLNQEDMESKHYMEYANFMALSGESLESYYHPFTNIINDLDQHDIKLPRIAINTKFLGCLGPDWQKYVTFVRQAKNLHNANYGLLYDYLKHHQSEVDKDCSLRGTFTSAPPSNSLALVAQSHVSPPPMSNHSFAQGQNYFNYPQTTSHQVVTYDSPQQPYDIPTMSFNNNDTSYYNSTNEEDDEDLNNLNQGLVLIARAFGKFTNKSRNHLRSSSNTRNQAVVTDGVLKFRIVILVVLVQEVIWEVLVVDRGLTILANIGTMLVLHKERLK